MANVKSFVSLLVATPVFSYRITLKILVTLLFFIICITLLDQTGLLLDQLASNPDVSKMFVTVGSYSWYYDKKVSKKEKETNNEEKGKDEMGQNTTNPHIIARRHITSGNKTDVEVLNKILPSKFDRVLPEELEELISIKSKTVQYCDPETKEVNKKDV